MIYLLRHGETLWNRQRRLQGQRDSPLTLRGIRQAQALGQLLRDLLDAPETWSMVSSPLPRTWQTAVIVGQTLGWNCAEIRQDSRLQERAFGAWEGLTHDEIVERDPAGWSARNADRWNHKSGDGESYSQVAERLTAWLAEQEDTARLGPVEIQVAVSAGADFCQGKERVAPWGGPPTSYARRGPGENTPRPEGVRPNWLEPRP